MKFTNNKITVFLLMAFFTVTVTKAQTAVVDPTPKTEAQEINKRQKIDGIIATVGDYTVLDSDIDKSLLEIAQNDNAPTITRCQVLGKLLEDRLLAHHAVQDSIAVSDAEVTSDMEQKMSVLVEQFGSVDKVVKFYKKNSEEEFRSYFFEILKTGRLTNEMQRKIVNAVEITPEEVRNYFKGISKEDLPVFGDEVEVAQIVIKPKISDEERQKVIDKLKSFKADILGGASFYSKAVLYSQDPGSKSMGGFMKINRRSPLVKEFKDVAFSLNEGEISEPFETMYGYHIIYVEKIRGQELDIRHILLFPKVNDEDLKEAKEEITNIRNKIVNKEISFADAARSSSDEKETKANGGALLNPRTLDTRFELTKMDPSLYSQVSNLNQGEISLPVLDEDETQKKMYKIITVTNRIPSHTADYAKDYLKIKELALKEKQFKAIKKWTDEKIKDTYIKINGEYRNCEFAFNWSKKLL
ncbi:MAG TPA: peptidylprolyl isomerase [Flavobacterium sp.]